MKHPKLSNTGASPPRRHHGASVKGDPPKLKTKPTSCGSGLRRVANDIISATAAADEPLPLPRCLPPASHPVFNHQSLGGGRRSPFGSCSHCPANRWHAANCANGTGTRSAATLRLAIPFDWLAAIATLGRAPTSHRLEEVLEHWEAGGWQDVGATGGVRRPKSAQVLTVSGPIPSDSKKDR